MSASTLVTVQILDVNDNSPVLVGDYSWKYLCTPRWEDQALMLASRDSDGPQHGGRLNFSLRSDATVRRNWKLTPINGAVTSQRPVLFSSGDFANFSWGSLKTLSDLTSQSWVRAHTFKNGRKRAKIMDIIHLSILDTCLFTEVRVAGVCLRLSQLS